MKSFLIIALAFVVGCQSSRRMICQACQKQEATNYWDYALLGTGHSEKLWLCQDCTDSRMPPAMLEKIRAARARGETGAISGWTSYEPPTNNEPSAS
jgi:hypothetical protein